MEDLESKEDKMENCVAILVDDSANNSQRVLKRDSAICWDDYFMSVAFLSAMRSKDPSTQVGACIVNQNKRIVGIGYNGFPRGCSDDELPWSRDGESELDTKYPVISRIYINLQ
jgi:dCMP deaminase